jgi:hypothetical protein
MSKRKIYFQNSLTANSVTSNSNYQRQNTLEFTPSVNNANVAVFYSGVCKHNANDFDAFVALFEDSNSTFKLQETLIDVKDSTDKMWRGGMAILENVSNASPTQLSVRFGHTTARTLTMQDTRLIAIELGENDVWAYQDAEIGLINTEGVSGYDEYASNISVTPSVTGNYAIMTSAAYLDDDNDDSVVANRVRLFVGDDGSETPYGYLEGGRGTDTNNWQHYWNITCFENTSNTFSFRYNSSYGAQLNVRQQYMLALNLDDWATAAIDHTENVSSTSSTSATDFLTNSFTLSDSDMVLVLASWFGQHGSSSNSQRSDFYIDAEDGFPTDSIENEPTNGSDATFNVGSVWCNGYMGVHNLATGTHDIKIRTWAEGSTTYIKSQNITALGANGTIQFNVYDGGQWKAGVPNVYDAGQWKEAEEVYVFDDGQWKSVAREGVGITGSFVDSRSINYNNTFLSPGPPPGPSPSPPSK